MNKIKNKNQTKDRFGIFAVFDKTLIFQKNKAALHGAAY